MGREKVEAQLFNKEYSSFRERKANLDESLDIKKVRLWIGKEVKGRNRGESSFSGQFTDKLGNYLLQSKGITSSRKVDRPFYMDLWKYRYGKVINSRTSLCEDIDEVAIASDEANVSDQDREEYWERLFCPDNLTAEVFSAFVKAGFYNHYPSDSLPDKLKDYLAMMKRNLTLSCQNEKDQQLLKKMNGKKSITRIADKLGVSHQSLSKRLKKICKNAEKRVQNKNKKVSI